MNVRIALLDMNNNEANQGFRAIQSIVKQFKEHKEEQIEVSLFDVRHKLELPKLDDFDIFISSGGPGAPFLVGEPWEEPFFQFLDDVREHNKLRNNSKKYIFLICHSFQLASLHWNVAKVCKRKSYSFGIFPIHKTEQGDLEPLFMPLNDPFFAVDSRQYQVIQPNKKVIQREGFKILALEKIRDHVDLERAIMAIRFSDEIFGTQFHPEADPDGLKAVFSEKEKRKNLIKAFGEEKYDSILDHLEEYNTLGDTFHTIIPLFLERSYERLVNQYSYV